MWTDVTHETKAITDYRYRQVSIDLTAAAISHAALACQDRDAVLGGGGGAAPARRRGGPPAVRALAGPACADGRRRRPRGASPSPRAQRGGARGPSGREGRPGLRDGSCGGAFAHTRTGNGPGVRATGPTPAVSRHRLDGAMKIASACRHTARHPNRALALLT